MRFKIFYCSLILALLCLSPLLGVAWLGLPLTTYLEFPPLTRYVVHAPYNVAVFTGLLLFEVAIYGTLLHRFLSYKIQNQAGEKIRQHFPWWGWIGIALCMGVWILAWNRFSFFETMQRYTFFPLWIGYILAINGLTVRRKGACLLSQHPVGFLLLFPVSALFWWYFEYLNRFVQNWYYPGSEEITKIEYIVHASICFSTVLPAVLSTYVYLRTFPRLIAPFQDWHPITFDTTKWMGLILVIGSVVALALLVIFSDFLFPVVWMSPLLVIVGVQILWGRRTIFHDLQRGEWQNLILPALAALLCGFFWEMWNWKSLARWEYSIPFVHRYEIFEMPLLGYAGYLPFGLECVAVVALLFPKLLGEQSPEN